MSLIEYIHRSPKTTEVKRMLLFLALKDPTNLAVAELSNVVLFRLRGFLEKLGNYFTCQQSSTVQLFLSFLKMPNLGSLRLRLGFISNQRPNSSVAYNSDGSSIRPGFFPARFWCRFGGGDEERLVRAASFSSARSKRSARRRQQHQLCVCVADNMVNITMLLIT